MGLITQDPYTSLYAYEKMTDPGKNIVLRSYRKSLIDGVDALVMKGRGRQTITTESDWDLLLDIIKFFKEEWPQEWKDFVDAIPKIRESKGRDGYSESREIRHVGSVPRRLERLIRKVFPFQQWDKQFVNLLVKRFKIFKVGGENN